MIDAALELLAPALATFALSLGSMTLDHAVQAAVVGLLVANVWSVLCRLNAMHPGPETWPKVRIAVAQHFALGLGQFAALVLPYTYALFAMAAGVFVFQAIGARRWMHGRAPGILAGPQSLPEGDSDR